MWNDAKMGSGGTGTYTPSDKTLQQRQVNAHTRQFQGFMRTLHAKLRLHLDDVARLQEIANLLKHALEWEQVRELYWDEYQAAVRAEVEALVGAAGVPAPRPGEGARTKGAGALMVDPVCARETRSDCFFGVPEGEGGEAAKTR